MSESRLEKLIELAFAATPWFVQKMQAPNVTTNGAQIPIALSRADTRYMEAANPETIISMASDLQALLSVEAVHLTAPDGQMECWTCGEGQKEVWWHEAEFEHADSCVWDESRKRWCSD